MKEYNTIFNHALAPITPGPSSSNTCGPVRIGLVCQQLLGGIPAKAVVEYYSKGAFPSTLYGMKSDVAFINGLLGKEQNAPGFNDAYENAKKAGMDVSFAQVDDLTVGGMETVRIRMTGRDGGKLTVIGESVGGGAFRIHYIDDCPADIRGMHHELLVFLKEPSMTRAREVADSLMARVERYNDSTCVVGSSCALVDIKAAAPFSDQLVEQVADAIRGNATYGQIMGYDTLDQSLKYGQQTVDRLFTLTNYVRYIGIALVALLIFIAMVFINNTIRLAILARRKEIAIMRLVGASNGFIRGPFLMEGALHALIGSLLAVGVLQVLRMYGIPKLQSALSFLSLDVSGNTYIMIYIVLVVLFAYFYTSITFNPLEVANNMKKSGGFIPGVRPGKPTSDFLNNILNYIVFIGATGLVIVCIVPIIASGLFNVGSLSFGGTSLIIIAGVILETIKAVESMMLVRNYKGFLND